LDRMRGALLYQVGENRLYDLRPCIDARGIGIKSL